MQENAQMKKDGKYMPMEGCRALVPFLVTSIVAIPFWLTVLLPLCIVWNIFAACLRCVCGKKPKVMAVNAENVQEKERDIAPLDQREFDIVLFGATGFTGKLAAAYLAKQYGSTIRWAMAGRRESALQKIKTDLGEGAASAGVIIADANNLEQIRGMVRRTKVVCTTAGPFDKYGHTLVAECAAEGTSYCDITGEVNWVRQMIDKHDETARATGARIVHLCGHDCVPWDLLTLLVSNKLKEAGDVLKRVDMFDQVKAGASGGTLATVLRTINKQNTVHKAALGFDPLCKNVEGQKGSNKLKVTNQNLLGYNSLFHSWVGPFVMAAVNGQCVRRAAVGLGQYGPELTYYEAQVYPNFFAGFVNFFTLIILGTILATKPVASIFLACGLLPKPGQGPSVKQMNSNFLQVTAFGHGARGNTAKATLYFPTDPGYRDTARMLVESGLALALELDKTNSVGGVWTPATCQGTVLLDRLVATGCSCHAELLQKASPAK